MKFVASPSPSPSGHADEHGTAAPRMSGADGVARVARGRSGGRVREEGCGRRVGGTRPHPLARQPKVDEELLHDARILDRRQML
jgi:hypothetical protein